MKFACHCGATAFDHGGEQCTQCGRIYLHDASDDLHAFAPELQSAPARQFASRAPRSRRHEGN